MMMIDGDDDDDDCWAQPPTRDTDRPLVAGKKNVLKRSAQNDRNNGGRRTLEATQEGRTRGVMD